MLQKVQKYINKLNMISPKDTILIGVSGGADSVALLLALEALYRDTEVSLEIVHVEHGIRGIESVNDAEFVKELCRKKNLICYVRNVDVPQYAKDNGLGIEEAARVLRYKVFSELAKEKDAKIALAHHMEDNAETILFQMVRGSALAGICGIQPIREDENGITYIRPFLHIHRAEIEEFLNQQEQNHCTDSTNLETEFSRNYMRQQVLPALKDVNAQAVGHINEIAENLSELYDFLTDEVILKWDVCVKGTADGVILNMEEICKLHPVLQKEMIYRGIAKAAQSKKDIGAVHVKSVQDLYKNQSGKEVHLPYGLFAKKVYDKIWIGLRWNEEKIEKIQSEYKISTEQLQTCKKSGKPLEVFFEEKGELLKIRVFPKKEKNMSIPTNPYTKWLDYDKIKDGFCIRNRQSGDYFISDTLGHHKKLNRYFIDEKVPAKERDTMWLIAKDDIVLWLIGGRISEHIKVTKDTETIIELIYEGGKGNER